MHERIVGNLKKDHPRDKRIGRGIEGME